MINALDIERLFEYHAPDEARAQIHSDVRKELAEVTFDIVQQLPPGDEAWQFVLKMQEAMFWANAAIARPPKENEA